MGIDTKGFIHSKNAIDFKMVDLFRYLDDVYGVEDFSSTSGKMFTFYLEGAGARVLYVFDRYYSYVDEGYPKFVNTADNKGFGKPWIVLFDIVAHGNSADIIASLVEYFGGGYFIENDCNDNWKEITQEKK